MPNRGVPDGQTEPKQIWPSEVQNQGDSFPLRHLHVKVSARDSRTIPNFPPTPSGQPHHQHLAQQVFDLPVVEIIIEPNKIPQMSDANLLPRKQLLVLQSILYSCEYSSDDDFPRLSYRMVVNGLKRGTLL